MGRSQEDVRRISFWRAVVSEFLGTAFLLMVGCGAWCDTDRREHAWTVKVAQFIEFHHVISVYFKIYGG